MSVSVEPSKGPRVQHVVGRKTGGSRRLAECKAREAEASPFLVPCSDGSSPAGSEKEKYLPLPLGDGHPLPAIRIERELAARRKMIPGPGNAYALRLGHGCGVGGQDATEYRPGNGGALAPCGG